MTLIVILTKLREERLLPFVLAQGATLQKPVLVPVVKCLRPVHRHIPAMTALQIPQNPGGYPITETLEGGHAAAFSKPAQCCLSRFAMFSAAHNGCRFVK